MRFWTFLHDSLGHMARWHSKRFVLCPQRGASEHCSWKRIYLLSVRMNKAFHHLAAVLDWASDETPPSLAFCSPSEEAVGPLVWCRTFKKNKTAWSPFFFLPWFFSRWGTFERAFATDSFFFLKPRGNAVTFEVKLITFSCSPIEKVWSFSAGLDL